jgi:DNA-binding MarR family transcriptional regulator
MSPEQALTEVLQEWSEVFMHRSMRDFKRFMDESGLSASQANALMRLYHEGACGVSDIGSQLGFTNAAASQMTERLVQMGLVERSEQPEDRRVKQLSLTPNGRALVERGITARRAWMEALTAKLTPEQQALVAQALVLLTEAAK